MALAGKELGSSEAISGHRVSEWPRIGPAVQHDSVTTSCSVTRPKNHVDST